MMKHFCNILQILLLSIVAATLSAQNTNPQAILFTREKVRPGAEKPLKAFDFCTVVVDEWFAASMSANFPAGTDEIQDGCNTSGRNCLTNNDVINLVTACMALQAFVNGDPVPTLNRLNVLVKPAVNRAPE